MHFFAKNLAYIKKKQYLCSRKGLTTNFDSYGAISL